MAWGGSRITCAACLELDTADDERHEHRRVVIERVERRMVNPGAAARSPAVGAALVLALVVASGAASAAPSASVSRTGGATRPLGEAVSVAGPTRCLDAAAVGGQVARWLGRDTIDTRVSIVVATRDGASGTTAALSFEVRREGKVVAVRRFDPPPATCADVRRVVAIAIALAIESTILAAESEVTAPPPAPAPEVAPPAPPPAPRFPRPSWGLDATVLTGVVPAVAFGVRAHADVDLAPRFALRAGTLTTFPTSAPIGPGRAETRLVAADASGCWIALHVPVDLRACGGVAGGGAHVEGEAFDPSLSRSFPWVAAVGHIGLRVVVWSWLAVEAGVDGLVSIVRPDLEVTSPDGAILFSRSFPVAGAAGDLGVGLTF